MFLHPFVNVAGQQFSFSAEQASRFAKLIAEDFNPIHDPDSKRFCVPGDLLFAYLMSRFGLSEQLTCQFEGMVGADEPLQCVENNDTVQIVGVNGKVYLTMAQQGARSQDCQFIEQLVKDYVKFSGQNFPHILQPLMERHQLMINPQRPLVIYQSMSLQFSRLPAKCPSLQLISAELLQDGKRAQIVLRFAYELDGETVGTGEKRLLLGSLVPYDAAQMQGMVDFYNSRKAAAVAA